MPAPGNYNSAHLSIIVDPLALWRYATVDLTDHATGVIEALGRINIIWQGLKLGWAGETADAAEEFSNLWTAAITGLFGTESSPESGAIARLQTSVSMAAINYAVAEETTWRMFRDFNFASDGGYGQSGSNLDPQGNPYYNADGSPVSIPNPNYYNPDGSPDTSPYPDGFTPGHPFPSPSNEPQPPVHVNYDENGVPRPHDDGDPADGPIQVYDQEFQGYTPPGLSINDWSWVR